MLEDDSGRIRLVGSPLASVMLVTGCIVAVLGTENAAGDFEVIDIKFPDLPPQPERWTLSKPPARDGEPAAKKAKTGDDVQMTDAQARGYGGKIALVSGLEFSSTDAGYSTELNMLLEFLLGQALDGPGQSDVSRISRLIIAGNSIGTDTRKTADDEDGNAERKAHKKYGYDSSAYNPIPSQLLDDFLAELLPSMPVTLLPGSHDPANASYPQQPVHPAMFPRAKQFTAPPRSGAADKEGQRPGWFDPVTNPWEAEVEGWRVLGTGGQNVDDVFRYVDGDDRLAMMEHLCRWRCSAPTAPDTLCRFPQSLV